MRTLAEIDADIFAARSRVHDLTAERREAVAAAREAAWAHRQALIRSQAVAREYDRNTAAQRAEEARQAKLDAAAAIRNEIVRLRHEEHQPFWMIGHRFGKSGTWAAGKYREAKS